ncbi:hypothetical protein EYF80_059949 [Liparis tanakae]|uniref:Uncharacterized protein n=1 Tax=Liparis tanakae TaxID=230148 RepID=A0A4Z2EMW0_9TELE|nr:hypothetical protein EYF80_059949 [Liparis tanakae]
MNSDNVLKNTFEAHKRAVHFRSSPGVLTARIRTTAGCTRSRQEKQKLKTGLSLLKKHSDNFESWPAEKEAKRSR